MTIGSDRRQLIRQQVAPGNEPIYGLDQRSPELQRLQEQQQGMAQAYSQAYGQQQDVYNQLQAQAAGTAGPSQAQLAAAAAQQQNVTNQLGMLAQTRGGSLASQARQAQGMGAASAMATQQQQAQMALQEQEMARQALQQQANVMGGQSLGASQFATGTAQQANQFTAGLQQQQLQMQMQADMFNQQAAADRSAANRAFGLQIGKQASDTAYQAAQSARLFKSDEKFKDIESYDADDEAIDAVRALRSTSYRYKPNVPDVQEGRILGILAQDLEATDAGREIVADKPEGKHVSIPGGVSLALAATAAMARKLDRMEARRGDR